jgi:ferredoxin
VAVSWRLQVDPVACDAFGHCAELVPELIWLDEWGYPVIDDGPIPADLYELAELAVRACPRRALSYQRVDEPEPSPAGPRTRRIR